MSDVFISYKRRMRPQVAEIAAALRELGLDVWFDASLEAGASFSGEISAEVRSAKAVIVCWTDDVFPHGGDVNGWVLGEATIGRERGVLVPVLLEPTSLDPPWNMMHCEDLTGWRRGDNSSANEAWRNVLAVIGRHVERPGLAEYEAAVASRKPELLKAWAQRYPGDPLAESAWTQIEELELAATRERLRQERTRIPVDPPGRPPIRPMAQMAPLPPLSPEPAGVASAPRSQPANDGGTLRRRDVIFAGLGGAALCAVLLLLANAIGWLGSSIVGLGVGIIGTALYGGAIALVLWQRGGMRDWRVFVLGIAFPIVALGSAWLISLFGSAYLRGYSETLAIGFGGGIIGAAGMFAVLFALRAMPVTPRNLAYAAVGSVACAALTGFLAGGQTSAFGPTILIMYAVIWQAIFTIALALTLVQPARSAKIM